MSIATSAIIAGVGAAGAIGGSAISAVAGSKAAGKQADAATDAAQLQKQSADESLAFQKQQYADSVARSQPWVDTGTAALGKINALQPFAAPTTVDEQNDPGYQFRLAEGQKALERSAAARGNVLGGGAMKAAERYGQDYSSNEYGNVYNRRMAEYNNNLSQLNTEAGLGQTTATGLNAQGANLGTNVGNTLTNSANAQGNSIQNAAAARASGLVNTGNTVGAGISSAGQSIADYLRTRSSGYNNGLDPLGIGELPTGEY